jgi:hypothetical protein|uniref:Uncharacterized protein n=1 Tax=Siphoviridae sp. ctFiA6 TaxID=2823573 RepID=A0A8S5LGK0_9CAUD|nr:MAG TPA: hypothetical protein [Siphoviridae sp. ctFiA6]
MKTIRVTFNKHGREYDFNTLDDSIKEGDFCLVYSLDRYSVVEVVKVLDTFNENHVRIVSKIADKFTILQEDQNEQLNSTRMFMFDITKSINRYLTRDIFRDDFEGFERILTYMLNNRNEYFYIGFEESEKRYFVGIFDEKQSKNDTEIQVSSDTSYYISSNKFYSKEQLTFRDKFFKDDPRPLWFKDGDTDDILKIRQYIGSRKIHEESYTFSNRNHIIKDVLEVLEDEIGGSFRFTPIDGNSYGDDLSVYYDSDTKSYSFDLFNDNVDVIEGLYGETDTEDIYFAWQTGILQKDVPVEKSLVPKIIRKFISKERVNLCNINALKLIQSVSSHYEDDDLMFTGHKEIIIIK